MPDKKKQKSKNEKVAVLYDKKYDKPFGLDKVQPHLKNHGDEIQEDLDNLASIAEEIKGDIEEENMEDIVEVDFREGREKIEEEENFETLEKLDEAEELGEVEE